MKYNVLIHGASGFVGLELIKILVHHKFVNIKYLCSKSSIGKKINYFLKKKIKKKLPIISNFNEADLNDVDIIFTALPHGEAQLIAKKLRPNNILIDLSADFRFRDPSVYEQWYNQKHFAPILQKQAVYGLSEFAEQDISKSNIISCPGCYPTSVQIPLIPLIKKNIINPGKILVDSKSGYSGAGKKTNDKRLYPNIEKNIAVYGVGKHRHMPEIDLGLKLFSSYKGKIKVEFTPHLIPAFRGIISTIYVNLRKKYTLASLNKIMKNFFKKNKFVNVLKLGNFPNTNDVINSNKININIFKGRSDDQLIIVSAIDNLQKGAAGQAVQNMNIRLGLNECEGLSS